MQDQEQKGGAEFEKTRDAVRGVIERLRSLETQGSGRRDDDIGSLTAALAKTGAELERLNFRYEARCGELARLKEQYADLERKFQMRPDQMRRAGEMEVAELVKKKHELAALEAGLEKGRLELAREKEVLERDSRNRVAAREEELAREFSARADQLRLRGENLALREKEVAAQEKRVKELLEEGRRAAAEELTAAFAAERDAAAASFQKEKGLLSAEAETWRQRASELLNKLSEAQARQEELDKQLQTARQAALASDQAKRLAEMEKDALAKRVEDWERRAQDLDQWRAEVKAAEEQSKLAEVSVRSELLYLRQRAETLNASLQAGESEAARQAKRADELQGRLASALRRAEELEKEAAAGRAASDAAGQKARMAELELAALKRRLEDWEQKGPELEKWRAELQAREEKCALIEENAAREARPWRDRAAELEIKLSEAKKEADKWHFRIDELQSQGAGLRRRVEELDKDAALARGQAAEAEQRRRMAELELESAVRRVSEWEKKAAEAEDFKAGIALKEQKRRAETAALERAAAELEERALSAEKAALLARQRLEAELPAAEAKLRDEKARAGLREQELAMVKEHFGKALSELAELSERLASEKERSIKSEAQKDAERAKKMEELVGELAAKERAIEEAWNRRHRALEAEQKGYQEEFGRRHAALLEELKAGAAASEKAYAQKEARLAELSGRLTAEFREREAKARAAEEELQARAAALDGAAAALAKDYERKTAALEELKRKLVSELTGDGGQR